MRKQHSFQKFSFLGLILVFTVGVFILLAYQPSTNAQTTFTAKINFQLSGTPIPTGYLPDYGAVYGNRGNGFTYGWNISNSANARDRGVLSDQRYDTLNHMQKSGGGSVWELQVPNGDYQVKVVSGDPSYIDSVYKVNVEGQLAINNTPTAGTKFFENTVTVTVSDGRLTVSNASGSSNNKIDFIEVVSAATSPPPPPPPPPLAPNVTTSSATSVATSTVTLNGSANPNGTATTGWFRYSPTNPGTCNDTFGTRVPVSGGASLGSGTTITSYSQNVSNLTPATTYYYCAIAQSSAGTSLGTVVSFTTAALPPPPPPDTTSPSTPTGLTVTPFSSSQINLSWNASTDNVAVTGYRVYRDGSLATAVTSTSYQNTGLNASTTYAYQVSAIDGAGNESLLSGNVSATTQAVPPPPLIAPSVTTTSATNVATSTATLNGSANPNGTATTGWFRYSPTNPGTCNDTFGTRVPVSGGASLGSGTTITSYSQNVSNLTPATTYYYCAIAQSSAGTSLGTVVSFTSSSTPPPPPSADIIRFATIGDYGFGTTAEADVANLVKSWNPGFIITLGDNNYDLGSASTIDTNIGQFYHSYIYPYSGSFCCGSSDNVNHFFPSLGNHDWETTNAQPYLNYFSLPGNERYYTFTEGPVQFFVIDSDSREPDGVGSTSIQGQWLQNQLAASTAKWKLVYFHHPPYSSGATHGPSPWMQWPFQSWGATAVLAGHEHNYERIIQNNFAYFVNGSGGKSLYSFGSPISGSEVRYNADYGAMLVEANADTITFKFYARTGALIDTYMISSPSPPPPSAQADYITQNLAVTPGGLTNGQLASFSAAVKNQGPGAASTSSVTRLRLDIGNDGAYDISPTDQTTTALAASGTETETWSNIWTAQAGTHKFEVCADTGGVIIESDETNNCVTQTFAVGAATGTTTTSTETLAVTLNASSSSGTAPLNGVSLTASVSGTASGTVNYTFYCNRPDMGTNITIPYDFKIDGAQETTYTASGLCSYSTAGTYTAKVIAEQGVALPAQTQATVIVTPPPFTAKINFQLSGTPIPTGYLPDYGAVYGNRGNGFTYGWNISNSANARDRGVLSDQRYDTLNHMQKSGGGSVWELQVPNGDYQVKVVSGDPSYIDSVYKVNVEGQLAINNTPTAGTKFFENTVTVTVSDGRLTVSNASGSSNNKIDFIEVVSVLPPN